MDKLAISLHATELVIALAGGQGTALAHRREAKPTHRFNGWIDNVLGFSQLGMWELKQAQEEFKRVCMALHLRGMGFPAGLLWQSPPQNSL